MKQKSKFCDTKSICDLILASYQEVKGVNFLEKENLPSKGKVAKICHNLLQLLFPGYHDKNALSDKELATITHQRVCRLIKQLNQQAKMALKISKEKKKTQPKELICRFMKKIPQVRKILRTDVQAAYEGDPAAKDFHEIILSYPSILSVAIQRLAHILYMFEIPLIPRMMTEWAHSQTGIDIHPGAQIGRYFFIDHGTGVVIGETCIIGNNVKLYHGVTLGARSFKRDAQGKIVKGIHRHPTVEDGVTIYPNATVLGGKTIIGANSVIGANVFIMDSVEPGTLLPARAKSE